MKLSGFLLIDKPKGITSHDVVRKLRNEFGIKKIGHTGTLDPNATGLLTVAVGEASKFISYLPEKDKVYQAELFFGEERDTDDITGEVTKKSDIRFTKEELEGVLFSFLGESKQIPPDYSARKINGKKLYDYARRGIPIENKREFDVRIDSIKIINDSNFPEGVEIEVKCSKGTYIRALIRDIGRKLGSLAYMGDLNRISSGPFSIENAISLDQKDKINFIHPVEEFLDFYPKIIVNKEAEKKLLNGNVLKPGDFKTTAEDLESGLLFFDDKFYGIAELRNGSAYPKRMIKTN